MGQQQLLLLLLSVVIVSLSVVAGLVIYQDQARQNQGDDVMNRTVRIAQEAISWRARSAIRDGGYRISYAPLAANGMEQLGIEEDLSHTRHAIVAADSETVEIVGVSTTYPEVGAYIRVRGNRIDSSAVRFDGSITLDD